VPTDPRLSRLSGTSCQAQRRCSRQVSTESFPPVTDRSHPRARHLHNRSHPMRSAWSPTQHAPRSGVLHQWNCLSCGNGRSQVGSVESAPERTVLADRWWSETFSRAQSCGFHASNGSTWPMAAALAAGCCQLHHPMAVVGQQPHQAGALAGYAFHLPDPRFGVLHVQSGPDGWPVARGLPETMPRNATHSTWSPQSATAVDLRRYAATLGAA
jgi:hypothetical protein